MPTQITLPYNFTPRWYQLPVLKALDKGYKRVVWVAHRRSGKDKTILNYIAKAMYERVGAYYYVFPTYKQAKKVIWNGMDKDGFKFTDHFPEALRKRTINDEMLIEMNNGSIFQLIGSDNIDSLVGSNPVGVVFSEWSLQNPQTWDYLSPILVENEGFAIFIYTPRGKNHGYTTLQMAQSFPEKWFALVTTVEDTKAIPYADLAQQREEIIRRDGNDAFYLQEYMCSFDVPINGAYYGSQMLIAENEGRITSVPYDMNTRVDTYWDLGMNDSMTIWFVQRAGREIHIIDYLENSGEGINFYIQELARKGYIYGDHYAPHDIKVRELGTGKSRLEVASSLGINFELVPEIGVDDGIQAARNILNRCWFDKVKCEKGIDCLMSYHKQWDEKNQVFKNHPEHDWSSHGADSFRYFAVAYSDKVKNTEMNTIVNTINDDPYGR
jgi:phage terminase large subunit